MAKRKKYQVGDVFLVPLNEELNGVGRVLRKDCDTVLIEMYHMKPIKGVEEYDYKFISIEKPLVMGWCYDDGLRNGNWKIIDYQPVPERLDMPYFWSQDASDMKYYVRKGSEESCIASGERFEIPKEDVSKYHINGIGNEISEKIRYIDRLRETGLLDIEENAEKNQEVTEGILDEDVAADVEAAFMELLDSGYSAKKATAAILKEFREELEDEEDSNVVYLALAEVQIREGCLQEEMKQKALEIIESGADLERWREADEKVFLQREAALKHLKQKLLNDN